MTAGTSRVRRFLVGSATLAGLLALGYGSMVMRPDPTAPVRRAHEERRERLRIPPKAPELQPPPSQAGTRSGTPIWEEPQLEPWLIREVGLGHFWPSIQASYTYRDPAEEGRAWQAVAGRCYYTAAAYSNIGLKATPPEAESSEEDSLECHRATLEPMMDRLAATVSEGGDVPLSDALLRATPTIVVHLALRGDSERAGRLLDRFVTQVLNSPWYHGMLNNPRLWPGSLSDKAPQLSSLPDFNFIAQAAILLDQARVETSYLDRIAVALERDAPSPEKLEWMAEQVLLEQFAEGSERHSDIYETRENALRHFAGGIPEWTLNTVQAPLLRVQYRDFFAAWTRRDIPAALAARASYTATANRMNLRRNGIDESFGQLRHESIARWCRRCSDPPERLEQLELARFVVASLRFRRATGRMPEGLAELVPDFLPAGSVGADGAQWGVREMRAFDGPFPVGPSLSYSFASFRWYLEQTGEPPDMHTDRELLGPLVAHYPARWAFWRLGSANPCGFYAATFMARGIDSPYSASDEQERLALMDQMAPGRSDWKELQFWMPIVVPDARALRLLRPQEGRSSE